MKINYAYYFILLLFCTNVALAKVSTNRIEGWLELDSMKQKINATMTKYNVLEAELKNETNAILEDSIDAADTLVKNDPSAALYMYYDMKKLKNKVTQTSLDIVTINKKYQELSDYIDLQFKELAYIRRKHLQLP